VFNKPKKPGIYANVAKLTVALSTIRVMSDNLRIRRPGVRISPGAPGSTMNIKLCLVIFI
jgi:hypothetical protein